MDINEAMISHLKEWLFSEVSDTSGGISIRQIVNLAEGAASTKLTVVELSKILKKSRRQTYRIIHLSFERPAGRLLTQIELQKAKFLLESMDLKTISDLMIDIDWNNQYYFCSIFEEEFGYHPKTLLSK